MTFVTDAPHYGGAERYVISMARCAERFGIRPHIHWMPMPGADSDVFSPRRTGDLSVNVIPPTRTRNWSGLIRAFRSMLQTVEPDALVVNACGRPRFWAIPWLARQAGLPSIWVHHMVDIHASRRLVPAWCRGRIEGLGLWRWPQTIRHRLAAHGASGVLVSNIDDAKFLVRGLGIRRQRIHVVAPGIDLDVFQRVPERGRQLRERWSLPDDVFVVGAAGRCVPDKGLRCLLDAVERLIRQRIPAACVIAGDGPQRPALIEHARRLGIDGDVRLISYVRDMPGFYSAVDAFALCSGTESFGLVLSEAMACGCPVVATPTAGARSQIDHGRTGWLLNGRCPDELAEVLRTMRQDSRRRAAMADAAHRHVMETCDIRTTFRRTMEVFQSAARPMTATPQAAGSVPA